MANTTIDFDDVQGTMLRTASTPLTWPATRGRKRLVAQRPLPSMMMATWRGTLGASGTAVAALRGPSRVLDTNCTVR
eukprot:gene42564-52785_t